MSRRHKSADELGVKPIRICLGFAVPQIQSFATSRTGHRESNMHDLKGLNVVQPTAMDGFGQRRGAAAFRAGGRFLGFGVCVYISALI